MRNDIAAQSLLAILLVVLEVAFEPVDVAVAFEGEDPEERDKSSGQMAAGKSILWKLRLAASLPHTKPSLTAKLTAPATLFTCSFS